MLQEASKNNADFDIAMHLDVVLGDPDFHALNVDGLLSSQYVVLVTVDSFLYKPIQQLDPITESLQKLYCTETREWTRRKKA